MIIPKKEKITEFKSADKLIYSIIVWFFICDNIDKKFLRQMS
jgi:hypothetical protein